jgi:FixJ family two-component response regulator
MPQINGLDFLTELRSSDNYTPFILMADCEKGKVLAKALNLGLKNGKIDFLQKIVYTCLITWVSKC